MPHRPPERALVTPRLLIACFALAAANVLAATLRTPLWDQDEAAYAGLARSMMLEGDWLTPSFPYAEPHRKTPLLFWLIAASYKLFGVCEFAARLPGVLALLLTAAAVWHGGAPLVGKRSARLAAVMLPATPLLLNLHCVGLTDGVLLTTQTVAALALLRGMQRPSAAVTLTLWSAVALGMLAKGPPIIVLVMVMMLVLAVLHPRRRNLVHLHPWLGLPAAALPLLAWGWAAYRDEPEYVAFLLNWYVLRRMGGTVFGQWGPPGYHFALMFLLMLPWSGLLIPALARAARGAWRRRGRMVLLAAWLAGGWLVWELPPSKLPTYALGAYPVLMLLVAGQARAWIRMPRKRAPGKGQNSVGPPQPTVARISEPCPHAPGERVASGATATRDATRARRATIVRRFLIGAPLVNLALWLTLVPAIEPQRAATKRIVETVREQCGPGATLVMARPLAYPSLPFYALEAGLKFEDALGRPMPASRVVIDWGLLWRLRLSELSASIEAQLPKRIPDADARRLRAERTLERRRSGERAAYVLDESLYAELKGELAGATPIRLTGWRSDKFEFVDFVVVIPRAP